jgi:hypothetical protein
VLDNYKVAAGLGDKDARDYPRMNDISWDENKN